MKYHRCNETMHKNLWWGHLKSTFVQNSQFLTPPPFLSPCLFSFEIQCMFALVSYLTLSQITFCSVIAEPTLQMFMNFQMRKRGVKREKRISWFVMNMQDQCLSHSYIHRDNKNIYKFIKNVKWKKNMSGYTFLIKNHLYKLD